MYDPILLKFPVRTYQWGEFEIEQGIEPGIQCHREKRGGKKEEKEKRTGKEKEQEQEKEKEILRAIKRKGKTKNEIVNSTSMIINTLSYGLA